eukprot:3306558-Rhodomonas_salina.1
MPGTDVGHAEQQDAIPGTDLRRAATRMVGPNTQVIPRKACIQALHMYAMSGIHIAYCATRNPLLMSRSGLLDGWWQCSALCYALPSTDYFATRCPVLTECTVLRAGQY